MSLGVGIGLLIAGSVWLPSTDWDVPICFVMALPTYVLAPWAFRQVYYFRWRWMLLAAVGLWAAIDGSYSLYWSLRGFDALAEFRPANFFYCLWFFGFAVLFGTLITRKSSGATVRVIHLRLRRVRGIRIGCARPFGSFPPRRLPYVGTDCSCGVSLRIHRQNRDVMLFRV